MIKIFLIILYLFFTNFGLASSSTVCENITNNLIASECYKKSKNNKFAFEKLEDLKKTTTNEVHDFIDYKKILLLKETKKILTKIYEFKELYPDSHLIKKIQLIEAEILFNKKEFKESMNLLQKIEKKYRLSKADNLKIKYLRGLDLYEKGEYKKAFKIIKDINIRNTTFKAAEVNNQILDFKTSHNLKLNKKEKISRLNNLYKNNQFTLFLKEYNNLSPKVFINKALIRIKTNKPNEGLKMLEKISNGDFKSTGSQSEDLEAIAESKYRIILFNLKTSDNNSLLAKKLNSILLNFPNYSKTNEVGYLSARLFTIDKNYKEAIKVYNWLIKTKSKGYIDKSFYGLGFSEYMLGNYKNAVGYFASLKESEQPYYQQLGSYWAGKSLTKLGDKKLGYIELNNLINDNKIGFYPYMASKILKIRSNKVRSPVSIEKITSHIGDMNLLKLSKQDKSLKKEVEVYIRNKLNSSNYQSYINDLYNAGEYNQVIKISYIYKTNNHFKFPKGYEKIVKKYSEKYQVDPNLIYALIREESLFDPKAKSWVGAKGLMQIMDNTANMLDKELNIKSSIYNPDDNINLGTYYIMKLMKRFNNNIPNVLAAYNGGPKNVEIWRKKFNSLEDDEFIESIPFKETNGYVKRVLRSYYYYKSN